MRRPGPGAPQPGEPTTPAGRGRPARSERYLLALGIQATALAIAVAERLPVRQPDGRSHRGRDR